MKADAMAKKDLAVALCARYEELELERRMWEGIFQEIAQFIIPRRGDFATDRYAAPAAQYGRKIHDSTAMWAHEQLASGLHSYLTSPTQRWLRLAPPVELQEELQYDEEVQAYLQTCTELMYSTFNMQKSNFITQAHELYLDVTAFGTAIMYIEEEYIHAPVRFATYHIGDCVIDEDAFGRVDTVGRKFKIEARQAAALFGDALPDDIKTIVETKPLEKLEFIHFVGPRKDFDKFSPDPKKKEWGSWYICTKHKVIVRESGYNELPYAVPRWSKLTGERWGRSPAMVAMPDIRMLNTMARTVIIGAQKQVDPPILAPDEGFLMPLRTHPGSVSYFNSTLNPDHMPRPLQTNGQIGLGIEMMERVQQQIIRSFYIDWMRLNEGPQMTATEVMTRAEDNMRMMAPAVSRQMTEFLDPVVNRTFNILQSKNFFPRPPDALVGTNLNIEYVSPIVKAQRMTQVTAVQQMLQYTMPLAEAKPEMLDRINADGLFKFVADVYDISHYILNGDREVTQIRQQRAEQEAQQAEMAAQNAMADTLNKAGRGIGALSAGDAGGRNR